MGLNYNHKDIYSKEFSWSEVEGNVMAKQEEKSRSDVGP